MYCFLTPNAPVIAELGLTAALLLANHTVAAQGHVAPDPVVGHGVQGPAVTLEHYLLALEALVGLLEAALVHAQPAAVAEGALQDVLRAHAAVGGMAEQVRVAPPVLALAEDVPAVQLPARPLKAAPEGDEHRQQHRAQRPQDQVPVRKEALVGLRPLLPFHLLQGRFRARRDPGGVRRALAVPVLPCFLLSGDAERALCSGGPALSGGSTRAALPRGPAPAPPGPADLSRRRGDAQRGRARSPSNGPGRRLASPGPASPGAG